MTTKRSAQHFTTSTLPTSVQRDSFIKKTNGLLAFAVNSCGRGDRFNLWYYWPMNDQDITTRLFWNLHAIEDDPDWDVELDWHHSCL